jgi:hypothetical protein
MKTHLQQAFNRLSSITILTLTMVLVGLSNTIKAQTPSQVINGLFTPTSAQRFFQEGRDKFATEARIFTRPEYYFNGEILKINKELLRQEKNPNSSFLNNNSQREYKLFNTPNSDRSNSDQ